MFFGIYAYWIWLGRHIARNKRVRDGSETEDHLGWDIRISFGDFHAHGWRRGYMRFALLPRDEFMSG
jgi:hypothetical protein